MTREDALEVRTLSAIFKTGSTTPALATASDGKQYVVKWSGGGLPSSAWVAEFLVGKFCTAWEIPSAKIGIARLPADVAPDFGTDEFRELVERSRGFNLVVEYLPHAKPIAERDDLCAYPGFTRLLHFVDSVFANFDRTPANPNILLAPGGGPVLIDHDACRFLQGAPVALPAGHLLEGCPEAVRAVFPEPAFSFIDDTIRELPHEWVPAGMNPVSLHRLMRDRLRAYGEEITPKTQP